MEILFDSILSIMQPGKVGLHQGSVRMRQEQQSLTAVKSAADSIFQHLEAHGLLQASPATPRRRHAPMGAIPEFAERR